ncbi:FecR family protein [Mucilaginibacter sp.]|uniref:FecR family protein n=1 Tax=Mucilaginibacter sp. TaxID=1882438 RepID=UPI0032668097
MMDEKSRNEFLEKYLANQHTEQEHELFMEWLNAAPLKEVQPMIEKYQAATQKRQEPEPGQYADLSRRIEESIDGLHNEVQQSGRVIKLWTSVKKIASVAAVVILCAFALIYFLTSPNQEKPLVVKTKPVNHKVLPGGNKAMLTLADGSSILLGSAPNGVLAKQANIDIRKATAGNIIYDASNTLKPGAPVLYNTITTPRGGQYQVTLSDGTKVWLNAASSLKFPAVFSANERVVELTGEAYFEVAKLAGPSIAGHSGGRIPFRVITARQTVEVLGTHFNINAYADESTINTTLLEGSVKVIQAETNNSQLLKPGQQAKLRDNIRVLNVDASEAIAWKNGYFNFSHENIGSIMRQVSRWYDVNIQYEGEVTQEGFVGTISKFKDVAQVLDMLQLTGSVHFKTENDPGVAGKKRIIIMP